MLESWGPTDGVLLPPGPACGAWRKPPRRIPDVTAHVADFSHVLRLVDSFNDSSSAFDLEEVTCTLFLDPMIVQPDD